MKRGSLMAFDLGLLAEKLWKYRDQFELSLVELSEATGIAQQSLVAFETGQKEPTGDEILILADVYKCDYRFFISNERLAPFEQTETLFRRYGQEFSKSDRWAVQEVLFLAECEHFMFANLGIFQGTPFTFRKEGDYFKGHGVDAADSLRRHLKYPENLVPMDVYEDFRSIGIHVFRRRLENPNISGLFVRHPIAGKCILINYNEDVYRQRFTAAHEAAHCILDEEEDVVVSFAKWGKKDLAEIRANVFASQYLMPPKFLSSIPDPGQWDENKAILWANKLKVSTEALAYALRELRLIDDTTVKMFKRVRVPKEAKIDPELPENLSPLQKERRKSLLERGLSSQYVNRCFVMYYKGTISAGRMAEMLLVRETELVDIANLFGEVLNYGS
jgi:Zn-dependent peptidase ImmA (M78 family)/DNA-binding XRE family transcriptional regulator